MSQQFEKCLVQSLAGVRASMHAWTSHFWILIPRPRTSTRRLVRQQKQPSPYWWRSSTSTTQTKPGWTSVSSAPSATMSSRKCGARSSPWSSPATASPWASTVYQTNPPGYRVVPACSPRWVAGTGEAACFFQGLARSAGELVVSARYPLKVEWTWVGKCYFSDPSVSFFLFPL